MTLVVILRLAEESTYGILHYAQDDRQQEFPIEFCEKWRLELPKCCEKLPV